jgi:two-component system chemotaxis response regulator CheY
MMLTMIGEHEIIEAANGAEGSRKFEEGKFDLIISDFMMPRMNGAKFLRFVRRKDKKIPFIMVTSEPALARGHIDCDTGPFTILQKPLLVADLQHAMEELGCKKEENLQGRSP